jgi:hypothetical protein
MQTEIAPAAKLFVPATLRSLVLASTVSTALVEKSSDS